MRWTKQETKTGDFSVKVIANDRTFFLHSRYNPRKEAEDLVSNFEIPNDSCKLLIVGIGAGYHVAQFLERYPDISIFVIEFNHLYALWAQENLPLVNTIIHNDKVTFLYSSNLFKLKNYLIDYLVKSSYELFIYKPSLELIEDKSIKFWFKQVRLLTTSFNNQKEKLEENFNSNLFYQNNGLSQFMNQFNSMPFILISAGPSLLKQMGLLKKMAETKKFVIACVGTSYKVLHEFGITPNFVMISDANAEIIKQFDFEYNCEIPLFFLSTANHHVVQNYRGPKFIVWQKGFHPAEKWAAITQEPLINTGGSVATCLLDLIVYLGAKSVALVGQDLAFTDNQTHSKGIHSNKTVQITESLIEINDFYQQKKVYTPLNLYSYRIWFENYALTVKDRGMLWNCTEGGAYIENWKNEKLECYFQTYRY